MRQFLLIIMLCFALASRGQDLIRLSVRVADQQKPLPEEFVKPRYFPDSLSLQLGLDSLMNSFFERGYLNARHEDLKNDTAGYSILIRPGVLFSWQLQNVNISPEALHSLRLSEYFNQTPLPFHRYNELRQKIIGWYENHGYPFASILADSVHIEEDKIKAAIRIEPSFYIAFDTLQLNGNVNLSKGFIANHTGIRPGQPYSEDKVREAAILLSDLPFLRINGEPSLQFTPATARLIIPARRQPANRFDGIAGVSSNTLDNKRLQLTGQLNLLLVNLFERGERFSMNWQGLGQGTQRLVLEGAYPYLLSTPLTTTLLFSLHKQDTAYLSLRLRPAFSWQSPRRLQVSIFADLQSTELLSTSRYANITSPPPQIDSQTSLYGLEAAIYSPGFFATLREGRGAKLSLSAGNKIIEENPSLPPLIYEEILLKQTLYAFGLQAENRLPLTPRTSMVLQINSQGLAGKQLFENELYRIGGFRSLKGFDEESILASFYGIMTGEIRYFTGEDSFFSLLFNVAYFERNLDGQYLKGWPWGTAIGLTIETAPGIISVYYAIGKGPETAFAFRNSKVHIGFVSLF
jgi:translocation and assembly module TamA